MYFKLIFKASERDSGSSWGEPSFSNVSLPHLAELNINDKKFVKVSLEGCLIHGEGVNDTASLCVDLLQPLPINSISVGQFGQRSEGHLGIANNLQKEQSGADYYGVQSGSPDMDRYLLYNLNEFQRVDFQFKLYNGSGTITIPSNSDLQSYKIVLGVELF